MIRPGHEMMMVGQIDRQGDYCKASTDFIKQDPNAICRRNYPEKKSY